MCISDSHNGYLYSNIWHDPHVSKIDAMTGEVVAKLDLSSIVEQIPLDDDKENVLRCV